MSNIADQFGQNLARHIKNSGLSQEVVADRAEVHRTQISQLTHGKHVPMLDTVIKLAGALGVSPSSLLEGMSSNPAARTPGEFNAPSKR
jgi:XRE family transcriptional regulator, regulator of sulfur utilization